MASNPEKRFNTTLIAIDRDRNSQRAVKWAVDNLLKKNSFCTLIHVRTKTLYPHDSDVIPKQSRSPTQEELHQLFLPFRGFCARKGIVTKELVLHDIDVASALIDYVIDNSINHIVVGAPRWNLLIWKFKDVDVPTSLIRSLPESCMVHIVSKGRVQSTRSLNISTPQTKSLKVGNGRGLGNNDAIHVARCVSNIGETHPPRLSDEIQDVVNKSNIYRSKSSKISQNGMEIEIRRLKSEQKRTIKKCRSISSESVSEKHMAMENEKFRKEKSNKVKARPTSADMESAEMLKSLIEMETQKTKQEEMVIVHEEKEKEESKRASNSSANNKIQFKRHNIAEIEVATDYFDIDQKVGEGGYGPVFKGVLDDKVVAVKALRPDLTQGEKQFHQEVLVLSTIRHPNIVVLLGACPEYGCLVYEYLENGSLEDRLFLKDNTPPIPWKTRFKIASEIATGLLFLHQTTPEPIVHRDLKPANILLDRNYVSKITDVGLARLVPPSVPNKTTQYHKTTAAGTFCYIDPEYQQTGLLGVKSDIYSLGVMLLQIITGKPPIGLAHLVEEAIEKDEIGEVLDPNVTDWPVEEALSFAKLALKCCEMRKRDRPALASVILPELNRLRDL